MKKASDCNETSQTLQNNKNCRKRKSKNFKKNFLKEFASYVTESVPLSANDATVTQEIFSLMSECIHTRSVQSIQNYVTKCPTFKEWRLYIQERADFVAFGKLCNVAWFHSFESLRFLCKDVLHPLMMTYNSPYVHAVGVNSGFNEACLNAYGIPVSCQSTKAVFSTREEANLNEQFIQTQCSFAIKEDIKILYMDLRPQLSVDFIVKYVKNASVVIFAGPMCFFPSLYRINELLIEKFQYHRCVYETFGVSSDRLVFDGTLSCTCVIVYYRPTTSLSCLPTEHIMQDSGNSLRQHYIRHAVSESIPNYWKYVLPKIPLATFFKRLQPLSKKCLFDQMLIDVFSNSHMDVSDCCENGNKIRSSEEEEEFQLLGTMQNQCDDIIAFCSSKGNKA